VCTKLSKMALHPAKIFNIRHFQLQTNSYNLVWQLYKYLKLKYYKKCNCRSKSFLNQRLANNFKMRKKLATCQLVQKLSPTFTHQIVSNYSIRFSYTLLNTLVELWILINNTRYGNILVTCIVNCRTILDIKQCVY